MRKWMALGLLPCLALAVAGWMLSAPKPVVAAVSPALEQGCAAGRGKLFFDVGG